MPYGIFLFFYFVYTDIRYENKAKMYTMQDLLHDSNVMMS